MHLYPHNDFLLLHGNSLKCGFAICNQRAFQLLLLCTAKSLQSCPTLWDLRDSSPPGSPIPGILQARTLEWVAIAFSNAWKWKVKLKSISSVRLLATPWSAAYQAPPFTDFAGKSTGVGCDCLLWVDALTTLTMYLLFQWNLFFPKFSCY